MAGEETGWRSRTETWAAVSAALMLAAALAAAIGKLFVGAALAALAISFATITMLAARLERQVLLRRAEAAEAIANAADQAERRFLSVASHDLAQPLHAVSLYHSALKKRVETEEARGILGKAEAAASSLATMLDAMSALNRAREAIAAPHIESFALQDVLERVAAAEPLVAPAAPTRMRTRTDPDLMTLALTQLARNAAIHGGGGRIEVSEDDDQIEITVIDSGPGVPAEDQARIFEPFVRLQGARSGAGLGAGLTIAQRISDALGLQLRVQSKENEGARFSLRAPLAS